MTNKIHLLIITLFFVLTANAQSTRVISSKEQFDELWNKAGNSKDLNAAEKNNIQNIDVKQKNVTNPNVVYKKIDTTNLEEFSSQPIIKGAVKSTPKNNKTITNTEKPLVPTIIKEEVKKETIPTQKKEKILPEPVKPTPPTPKVEDFSTQPIIKGKKNKTVEIEEPENIPVKKYNIDTTKRLKDFTFDSAPVINNNATYNRRNEPFPKTKEEIEDAIPVNTKSNTIKTETEKGIMKEAYAQYDKEADSLHTANKRRLDSIMKTLNIKVPIVINANDFVDIYVNGGGALIDGNSKQYDRISILHTGLIQREYKTKNDGVQRFEKKISKDELTKLAQYMVDMGFFDFNKDYDCDDADNDCNQRFAKTPQVLPLEVSLTAGQKKNKIKVAIYAPKTEKNWVHYPATLDKIMNAIYTIVER